MILMIIKLKTESILAIILIIILLLGLLTLPSHLKIYNSFYGENHLMLHKKEHAIELLYPIKYFGDDLNPILEQIIAARNIYEELLNLREKERKLISVAVVENTCGPGCGELNGSRIEIEAERFDILYNNVIKHNQQDHLLFYELGRTYWVFGDRLTCDDEKLNQVVHTGFAIFMRDVIIKKIGKSCAPINGIAFQDYLDNKQLEFNYYKKQTEIDFIRLVHLNSTKQDNIEIKATRIFASMLNQLYVNYGETRFLNEFSKNINDCINPEISSELFSNLLTSSMISSKSDLRELFTQEWKIPIK